MSPDIEEIAKENLLALVGKPLLIIEQRGDEWVVHQHSAESVMPQMAYPSARAAASRLLQLLHIGPVAPQTHPEIAEISIVTAQQDKGNGDV